MATPAPTPTIQVNPDVQLDPGNMLLFGQEVNTLAVFTLCMILVVVVTSVFVYALIRAGRLPPPTALVTALSVLTMLAIAGGIFSENDEAWTIAAAGIGALAGSVTAVFRDEASVIDRVTKRIEERRARQEQADQEQGSLAEDILHEPEDSP